jgi:hypothetical protein
MKWPRGREQKKWLGDYGRLTKNRTFHLLRKRVISNVVRMGTFLMSVDITTIRDSQLLPPGLY